MKKAKKNNKGFSLVELIVVVLIMAIIAVALAPQVMKWVDNSRIATDIQTADSVVSNAQLALTDSKAYSEVKGKDVTITLNKSGYEISSGNTEFTRAFCANAGIANSAKGNTPKLKIDTTVVVTVASSGAVSWKESGSKLTSDDLK